MNEISIEQVKQIIRDDYDYKDNEFGVYEGEAFYYIDVRIKDHYVTATTLEKLADLGLRINSFSSLNGKFGYLMSFSLTGDLK